MQHVVLSLDFTNLLKLRLPQIVVCLNNVHMRMEVQQIPSGVGPNVALRERLRYLKAVEGLLFRKVWPFRCFEGLTQCIVSQAAAMALCMAAHCVTVNLRNISIRIIAGARLGDVQYPTNLPTSTSGVGLELLIAGFTLCPAQAKNCKYFMKLRSAGVRIEAVGIDLACRFLHNDCMSKVLRRWGIEASVKLWNQAAKLTQAAEVCAKITIRTKSVVLECGTAQVMVLCRVVHAYMKYHSLLVYACHRPSMPVQKDPAAWWRYAMRCVLQHICEYSEGQCWRPQLLGKLPLLLDEYARQNKRPGGS